MKIQRGLLFLFISCGFLIVGTEGDAKPVQLFLDASSKPVCRLPVEIEILVLNANGEVEADFEGKKELNIIVEEGGAKDKSYYIHSSKVHFKKGKASFRIENREEETLDLSVSLGGSGLEGQIRLSFLDKDILPPKVVDIYEEGPGILRLEFNEELEEESAQELRNYKAVTNKRETCPARIEYHRTYVFLRFDERFLTDEEGYIELQGIKDLAGNEISSGLRSPDFKGTCTDTCPD